ncbi:phytoene desaturase family protein [Mycobacterium sp. IDR2000157661]|uniref:phytoene desaturase family protein n=1 Tax=Mycobacterium sp. IDR2000157661 TaxID=2867005 RepID=UPI001EEC681A|nr:phytoene desaturase family protein [Mycobacterium sp. IDR2000157661]ULE33089.1 phytoene desaturase [Mycobacterium sp. IDR2000157661]
MSRTVVIGAGLGGLATAARLAAAGHRVTVFESAPSVGGKLGVFERDGFTFDTGPSLLTMPAVLEQLFADTGGPADLAVTPVDPAVAYRFADGTQLVLPHEAARIPAALDDKLGPGAGEAWRRLHTRSRRLWELVGEPVLRRPVSVPALVRMSACPADLRSVAPWRTIDGLGRAMLPDPRLRTWLNRYATYSGSDPRRTPAVLSVTAFVEQEFGAWYVPGGLRRIVEAVAARCVERGVELQTGSTVESVLLSGGRAAGVRVDGRDVAADAVVSNIDAAVLHDSLLPAGVARTMRRRLQRRRPSMAGFVVLLGLSGRRPGAAHRVYFPREYAAEFDAIFGPSPQPVADPTIYVHAPDDPLLRPDDDSEGWFVLVNAPAHDPERGVDWDAPGMREHYTRHVLDLLALRGADIGDRIRFAETITPADLQRRTGAPGGAIYGSASHGPRAALRRPANRSRVRGLYLVGGSAHPGGGIPLVLMSAEIVAKLIGPAGSAAVSNAAPRPATEPSRRRRPRST